MAGMSETASPLQKAIASVGTASELARRLGISPAAVLQWEEIPIRRVVDVERVSGISRKVLRPDLFGDEQ